MAQKEAKIYARFSPRRNEETCESNDLQVEKCRAWCEEHGWRVQDKNVFRDDARSGDDEKRPGLWDCVKSLRPGEALVVWKYDRLARSVSLSCYIDRVVKRRRARIVSASGETSWDDPDPSTALQRRILQAFAEYERKIIAARTRTAVRRHIQNGRKMSPKPPYGYEFDPSNPKRVRPNPEEQEILKKILAFDAEGHSARRIVQDLHILGIRPRCGNEWWSGNTVKRILRRQRW